MSKGFAPSALPAMNFVEASQFIAKHSVDTFTALTTIDLIYMYVGWSLSARRSPKNRTREWRYLGKAFLNVMQRSEDLRFQLAYSPNDPEVVELIIDPQDRVPDWRQSSNPLLIAVAPTLQGVLLDQAHCTLIEVGDQPDRNDTTEITTTSLATLRCLALTLIARDCDHHYRDIEAFLDDHEEKEKRYEGGGYYHYKAEYTEGVVLRITVSQGTGEFPLTHQTNFPL